MLIPVILCGGAGARLWPLSRSMHPKPFIRLSDGQSLLQKAFLRGIQQDNVRQILTVTNRELLFKTEDDFKEVNDQQIPTSFILEPFGRNTAAAVAAAAINVQKQHGSDAIMLVLAADHLIQDSQAFHTAVQQAVSLAEKDKLVTFGIKPTSPETGYGYIQADGNDVKRFVEKPDLETAKEYLQDGDYFWNSGMFCFKAGTLLEQMQIHSENILESVQACFDVSRRVHGKTSEQIELDAEMFTKVPEDSIDFALLEKSDQIAVVPCDIGWSDIGCWLAMGELTPDDKDGNRVDGHAKLYDTKNCYIRSKDRLVGAVGVENLIVIDTPDALLVASADRAQDVKKVYAELKRENHEAHKLHQTVYRPWGSYSVLEEGPHFKIKRIEVKPHSSLSLQLHHHRSEHWVVLKGEAQIINGDQAIIIKQDESTFIPAGHKHRMCNATDDLLVVIEVQTGKYVGEDDIVRFEDKYGRCQ